jgi:hypothetical protein
LHSFSAADFIVLAAIEAYAFVVASGIISTVQGTRGGTMRLKGGRADGRGARLGTMPGRWIIVLLALWLVTAAPQSRAQSEGNVVVTATRVTPEEVRRKAQAGEAEYQYDLGKGYMEGRGYPKNPSLAVAWFKKAAAQGYSKAQCSLAGAYLHGEGVAKDVAAAADLLVKLELKHLDGADDDECDARDDGQLNDQDYPGLLDKVLAANGTSRAALQAKEDAYSAALQAKENAYSAAVERSVADWNAQHAAQAAAAPAAAVASTPPRIALVIGNSRYAKLAGLTNPARDADLIAASLRADGFQVELVIDADQRGAKAAIQRLGQRLRAAGPEATGLFYFAGHGLQFQGTNYLVPVTADIQAEGDLELDAVSADSVVAQMRVAGNTTNIIILDACRDVPVLRASRSDTSRGLARMTSPTGTFIAYSTGPGETAEDGSGTNSPFALALAAELAKPGEPIEDVFRNVRKVVLRATGQKQTPWDSSSLVDEFTFRP